ncbi:MAG TPA: sigma-E processing peptidase SpoIIGA [Pseudogracilibacillus sp.]|nr:sigma-E processing peptidase SpoIIGA [Pseudogracilibacillus sp.]
MIVVYLDIVILLNFLFNFILLSLTCWIIKQSVSKWRLLLGTTVATIFIPIQLLVPYAFINSATANILLSFVIVFSTFGSYNILKNVLYFYFISFIVGGGTIALHSIFEQVLLAKSFMFVVDNVQGSQTSLVLLLLSSFILFHFTKGQLNEHTRDKYMYKQEYEIAIKINGIERKTIGYVDTGNHLVDTLSRRPVVVCDGDYLQQFFTDTDWLAIQRMIEENQFTDLPMHMRDKVRVVPYQGVGGESKYMYTLKVEQFTIYKGEERLATDHVLVGIQLQSLISDQSYHCLLHPDLIQIHALQVA